MFRIKHEISYLSTPGADFSGRDEFNTCETLNVWTTNGEMARKSIGWSDHRFDGHQAEQGCDRRHASRAETGWCFARKFFFRV